jgi:DNA polymerase III subunit delta'
MSVWDALVGQRRVIEALDRAVHGEGMTHAWLFTGPPGSGRSNAAIAFAAALQCERAGCGECEACRTTVAGTHPDVVVSATERSVLTVDLARELVAKSALKPVRGRWHVMIVEDADRLNDQANNALLKAVEEPVARTVWVLCAPHVDDVLPTIRSRSRVVRLATPSVAEVSDFLVRRHDVAPSLAAHAARASQGHIGRARALALDEESRRRRREVVRLPARLHSLGDCMGAAADIVELAKHDSEAANERYREQGMQGIEAVYGEDRRARASRSGKAAVKHLDDEVRARKKRAVNDTVDRVLMDLVSVYRDVIVLQQGAPVGLVNDDVRGDLEEFARRTTPEDNLRRIDAVYEAREQMLEFNTPPLLALESMMLSLMVHR